MLLQYLSIGIDIDMAGLDLAFIFCFRDELVGGGSIRVLRRVKTERKKKEWWEVLRVLFFLQLTTTMNERTKMMTGGLFWVDGCLVLLLSGVISRTMSYGVGGWMMTMI